MMMLMMIDICNLATLDKIHVSISDVFKKKGPNVSDVAPLVIDNIVLWSIYDDDCYHMLLTHFLGSTTLAVPGTEAHFTRQERCICNCGNKV